MLSGKSILIVEDNPFVALDFAMAVERMNGIVLGPLASVTEAIALVDKFIVSGAVIDALPAGQNVAPLIDALAARGAPLIVQIDADVPPHLSSAYPHLPIVRRPLQPAAALYILIDLMRPAQMQIPVRQHLD